MNLPPCPAGCTCRGTYSALTAPQPLLDEALLLIQAARLAEADQALDDEAWVRALDR